MRTKRQLALFILLSSLGSSALARDLALTITSDPTRGEFVGSAPCVAKFPRGYFHQAAWIVSKVLRAPVTSNLSMLGYESDQFTITDGPYERRNLNGQYFGNFWIITGQN